MMELQTTLGIWPRAAAGKVVRTVISNGSDFVRVFLAVFLTHLQQLLTGMNERKLQSGIVWRHPVPRGCAVSGYGIVRKFPGIVSS